MSVFVSHSQQDEAAYSTLCLTLDGAQVDRWDPEEMAIGWSLADQLREAIRSCDACVFLATKRSVGSSWCMAELGAFWGAGKQVIVFLADAEVDEADLPVQFSGTLWTRDARRVLETVQGLSPSVGNDVLTPDLILLLRYLERDDRWVLPDHYGRALAAARGVPDEVSEHELRGWQRAVRYGLLYLAYHGLTQKQADTSVTYTISPIGKAVLNSPQVQKRFSESFAEALLDL
ncbi:MAG TPA: toll/interleukin-1 receptor domain-containing protein [Longimicrobiales bacterium]|nr:toll/interleukin-1 receptor domain-containing protein [Longimicrobiales bacterium]